MTVEELATRVDLLERENRRLRRAGAAVLVLAVGVAIVGAAMPAQLQNIEARSIEVFDENGFSRAVMNANGIAYYDENGRNRASIAATGFLYSDENGNARTSMDATGFLYADENGRTRAKFGRSSDSNPASGARTASPAQAALYDADGNRIWSAIR